MLLFLLSYLGGVLAILSPCILPFVFARSDQPFARSGLPLLLGMAVTFAAIATLATLGGSRVVHANQVGRAAALVLLAVFGLTLLLPQLADRLTRPLVAPGGKITFRFHARDLHLVLGPGPDGKTPRFKVTLDGQSQGANHGMDTDMQGNGAVTSQRLYQLIRLKGGAGDRTFAIQFLDPGVQAFAFTFG
jgi:hypothetical protein